jgi:hypothetical protein
VWSLGGHYIGTGADTWIGIAGRLQPPEISLIDFSAEALPVRSRISPASQTSLVPFKAQPEKVVFNLPRIFFSGALWVKIFYPKNPPPSGFPDRKP